MLQISCNHILSLERTLKCWEFPHGECFLWDREAAGLSSFSPHMTSQSQPCIISIIAAVIICPLVEQKRCFTCRSGGSSTINHSCGWWELYLNSLEDLLGISAELLNLYVNITLSFLRVTQGNFLMLWIYLSYYTRQHGSLISLCNVRGRAAHNRFLQAADSESTSASVWHWWVMLTDVFLLSTS